MLNQPPPIRYSGKSQQNRFPEAMMPGYVTVDERSFEELLVFGLNFSRLVKYYNLQNEPEGDWSDFFIDESVVLAAITQSKPGVFEDRFKAAMNKAERFRNPAKKRAYLGKGLVEIHQIARQFGQWERWLQSAEDFSGAPLSIRKELRDAIISKLRNTLAELLALHQIVVPEQALADNSALFGSIWQTDAEFAPADDFEAHFEAAQRIFHDFYETLLYLKNKSADFFAESLRMDTHYPEVALFLAFLRLFGHAQSELNQLTKRHLDYYYYQVLEQQRKTFLADQVYLALLPEPQVPFVEVPEGTAFIANLNGQEWTYRADHNYRLNQVRVGKLLTQFVRQDTIILQNPDYPIVTAQFAAELPIGFPAGNTTTRPTYALFGEDQTGFGEHERTMRHAQIGFAVASPGLFLQEGERVIHLIFSIAELDFDPLLQWVARIGERTKDDPEEVFIKIFLQAFRLSVTTPAGWLDIDRYSVSKKKDGAQWLVRFVFELGTSDPALSPYQPTVHGGQFQTAHPIAKVLLNHQGYVYGYTLLKDLKINNIAIHTEVKGVKNLTLANNLGSLSQDSPFYPFGLQPRSGAYLLIGNNEVFQKKLDDLRIHLHWFDLPRTGTGFFGHYEDYGLDIDNTSYEVRISVQEEGRFKPHKREEQETLKLFRTEDHGAEQRPSPQSRLHEHTVFGKLGMDKLVQPANYTGIGQPLPTSPNQALRGYLRLELAKPDVMFAHDHYPEVLSKASAKAFAPKGILGIFKKKAELKLPPAPYSPQLQSVSLDYTATTTVPLADQSLTAEEAAERGGFFHILPFGHQQVYPSRGRVQYTLLPDFQHEGYLYIGLTNVVPPQHVSFLFELFDAHSDSSEEVRPETVWHYLHAEGWKELETSKIVENTTNRFIRTGIVTVELPYDLQKGGTMLPADFYWLRIGVLGQIEQAARLVSVRTQVITATLSADQLPGNDDAPGIPARTITRTASALSGIAQIEQPLPSTRGRMAEPEAHFYTRVSERLKHRNRAVLPSDFEHLILSQFPEIQKVTCIPNRSRLKDGLAPGHVMVIVSAKVNDWRQPESAVVSNELLFRIWEFARQFTSPFVKLEVRNPVFEPFKIICQVKFKVNANYGFFKQRLLDDINQYLTGNLAAGGAKSLELGGRVYNADIQSFMKTLPYLDFITMFSIVQLAKDLHGYYLINDTARQPTEYLQATQPWSVLVPSREHLIMDIYEEADRLPEPAGVGQLAIGQDWVVPRSKGKDEG